MDYILYQLMLVRWRIVSTGSCKEILQAFPRCSSYSDIHRFSQLRTVYFHIQAAVIVDLTTLLTRCFGNSDTYMRRLTSGLKRVQSRNFAILNGLNPARVSF